MAAPQSHSSFNCELKILRAKNLEYVSEGDLFVRYYLLTGNGRRIHLTTREISSTCDQCWNDPVLLECQGDEDAMNKLRGQSVLFELRWRKSPPFLGSICGSKILFKAELGWKDVLGSSELSLQKWVTSSTTSKYIPKGVKPPALWISMKIRYAGVLNVPKRHLMSSMEWKECGCRHGGCNGRDDDIFALAAVVEIK